VTSETIGETGIEKSSVGRDLRLSRRFACEGFAEAFALEPGFLFRGEIRDISETGCYIKTKARLKLERLMDVDLFFTLGKRNYRILAHVMEVRPGNGVGLKFQFFDPEQEDTLKGSLLALVANEKLEEV
jgi:hypothetical protein